MVTNHKTDVEKLSELLKRLGLIPATGFGDTMLHFQNSQIKHAQIRIEYKIENNVLVVNEIKR